MKDLNELRVEIDEIDNEILKLFSKRMEIVKKIGEYKIENNLPILNTEREKKILGKCAKLLEDDIRMYGEELMRDLMFISRKYQSEIFHLKR